MPRRRAGRLPLPHRHPAPTPLRRRPGTNSLLPVPTRGESSRPAFGSQTEVSGAPRCCCSLLPPPLAPSGAAGKRRPGSGAARLAAARGAAPPAPSTQHAPPRGRHPAPGPRCLRRRKALGGAGGGTRSSARPRLRAARPRSASRARPLRPLGTGPGAPAAPPRPFLALPRALRQPRRLRARPAAPEPGPGGGRGALGPRAGPGRGGESCDGWGNSDLLPACACGPAEPPRGAGSGRRNKSPFVGCGARATFFFFFSFKIFYLFSRVEIWRQKTERVKRHRCCVWL